MAVSLEDIVKIHQLKQQGYNISEIARATGRTRKTVRKHLARGLKAPSIRRRKRIKPRILEPYEDYLAERVRQVPGLTGQRLMRDIRAMGYTGSYATLTEYLRKVRPKKSSGFVPRFETPAGQQAQVDFSEFRINFTEQQDVRRRIWLFSMVLGHSRWMWGRFCTDQKQRTMLRMHMHAFEAMGGTPHEVLHDRMKTAVISADGEGGVRYNPAYVDMLGHYGATPHSCRAYRAQTKGKVERSFGYVKSDFYPGRAFRNLQDLNAQFTRWRKQVANRRRHATTGRIVDAAFAEERPTLQPLPAMPYNGVIACLRRRVSKDGMVSVEGNTYSLPDGVRGRSVQVQLRPHNICIIDGNDEVVATHGTPEGRGSVIFDPSHRRARVRSAIDKHRHRAASISVRDLSIYDRVGRRLAAGDAT